MNFIKSPSQLFTGDIFHIKYFCRSEKLQYLNSLLVKKFQVLGNPRNADAVQRPSIPVLIKTASFRLTQREWKGSEKQTKLYIFAFFELELYGLKISSCLLLFHSTAIPCRSLSTPVLNWEWSHLGTRVLASDRNHIRGFIRLENLQYYPGHARATADSVGSSTHGRLKHGMQH